MFSSTASRARSALLLSLIEARQLDVLTVPLGELAERVPGRARRASRPTDRQVSAFVAVAATDPDQEPGDAAAPPLPDAPVDVRTPDPEAELRERLLLYRAYRDAGRRLAEGAEARVGTFRREAAAAGAAARRRAPAEAPPLDPVLLGGALARLVPIAVPPPPPAESHRADHHAQGPRRDHPGRAARAPVIVLQDLLAASATAWSSRSRSWRCSSS